MNKLILIVTKWITKIVIIVYLGLFNLNDNLKDTMKLLIKDVREKLLY